MNTDIKIQKGLKFKIKDTDIVGEVLKIDAKFGDLGVEFSTPLNDHWLEFLKMSDILPKLISGEYQQIL